MKKRVSLKDLKVGDEVEIVEAFPNHLATVRGELTRVDGGAYIVGSNDCGYVVILDHPQRTALQVDVEQEDPPAVHGAVVKYYDPVYLRTSVAHYAPSDGWFDIITGGPVELDGKDWTVLFDPRKDS